MKYTFFFICLVMLTVAGYGQVAWKKVSEELIVWNHPVKEYHASSIVEAQPGKLLVTFFGGSREGVNDVTIWLTTSGNKQWSKPASVVNGVINDSTRFPCWNPVLFKDNQGKLFLFYKVGPNPASWWGMVTSSTDTGRSWSIAQRLPGALLGPIKNKPVQLADGTILSPSSSEAGGRWTVHIERSVDAGANWEFIAVDTANPFKVIQPSILIYPGKRLQMLCRSDQDSIVQAWSEDNGKSWGKLSKMNLPNPNSGIDAITLKNGWQLLVYNPTVRGKEWFNNRGKLNVAVSKDGIHWKNIAMLESDDKKEFSYPAVIQTSDGKVHITYTYDRKNIKHVVLAEN